MGKQILTCLELFLILSMIMFQEASGCVSEQAGASCTEGHTFYAAKNSALTQFGYVTKRVRSRISCAQECNKDESCKSFNFINHNNTCELNLVKRLQHPGDFKAVQGSLYFDADKDTPVALPLHSLRSYRSCKMLLDAGYRVSGVYTIYLEGFGDGGLRVYCDMEADGGGWIVIQRRQDGSVDFYRNWAEYQSGFGDLSGEFWLGNDNLVTVTSNVARGAWELRVDLKDSENNTAWAKYSDFKISPGEYKLTYSQYNDESTAIDALDNHRGRPFSTKDRDNDASADLHCAQEYKGAWWFNWCFHSHLNGEYHGDQSDYQGLKWDSDNLLLYSLKACSMELREIGQ